MTLISVGDRVPIDSVTTIDNQVISLINGKGLVHLQLKRFSGCPLCNVHMRFIANHLEDFEKVGLKEILVLHSDPSIIQENQGTAEWSKGLTFVGDPKKEIYAKFGVGEVSGKSAFLSPRILKIVAEGKKYVKGFKRAGDESGKLTKPAEMIIDTSCGKIIAIKYGENVYDQWTIEEILSKVKN